MDAFWVSAFSLTTYAYSNWLGEIPVGIYLLCIKTMYFAGDGKEHTFEYVVRQ